jgi:hypothetical protein
MTEAEFQTKFTTWKKYNHKDSGLYELKISPRPSIPFTRLEVHQEKWLYTAKHDQICYKIPDVGYDKKPADMFCLAHSKAYVVVMFYVTLGTKHFYMIDIDDWIKERENSVRRSLTEDRAKEIGVYCELFTISSNNS